MPLCFRAFVAPCLGLVLALLAGCASMGPEPLPGEPPLVEGRLEPGGLDVQLEAGRAALADERPWHATARAAALRRAVNLTPEERSQAEALLEESMLAAARAATRSKEFTQISEQYLPRRSRAIQAVGRARLLTQEDRHLDAYRTIANLEREHPTHHLRPEAGSVLADAGLSLAQDGGRYLLFFKNRGRAVTVLEYLVIEHPSHPRCAEAYAELAAIYEEGNQLDYAIDRHSDLLLYHPDSSYASFSEARVPELRLARMKRDDFDRGEFLAAEGELERWLAQRAGRADTSPAEEARVRELLATCGERLVENDLGVARFYRRTGHNFGARLHADRALVRAEEAGFSDLAEEASDLLASVAPEAAGPSAPVAPAVLGTAGESSR